MLFKRAACLALAFALALCLAPAAFAGSMGNDLPIQAPGDGDLPTETPAPDATEAPAEPVQYASIRTNQLRYTYTTKTLANNGTSRNINTEVEGTGEPDQLILFYAELSNSSAISATTTRYLLNDPAMLVVGQDATKATNAWSARIGLSELPAEGLEGCKILVYAFYNTEQNRALLSEAQNEITDELALHSFFLFTAEAEEAQASTSPEPTVTTDPIVTDQPNHDTPAGSIAKIEPADPIVTITEQFEPYIRLNVSIAPNNKAFVYNLEVLDKANNEPVAFSMIDNYHKTVVPYGKGETAKDVAVSFQSASSRRATTFALIAVAAMALSMLCFVISKHRRRASATEHTDPVTIRRA